MQGERELDARRRALFFGRQPELERDDVHAVDVLKGEAARRLPRGHLARHLALAAELAVDVAQPGPDAARTGRALLQANTDGEPLWRALDLGQIGEDLARGARRRRGRGGAGRAARARGRRRSG